MTLWHVQHARDAMDQIDWYPTQEEAIEAACRLIDLGRDVCGIGAGSLGDTITRDDIARIYAMWFRARLPFGIGPRGVALRVKV